MGFKRFLFNRYYPVRLPDGNYVAAFLDDGYYLRYRLAGSVQLPIGRAAYMEADEKKLLYEQHKTLNYFVLSAVWVVVLVVYILLVTIAGAVAKWISKKRSGF